jgi:SAM-dependent methyltransferase
MDKVLYRCFYEVEDAHWWFVARKAIVLDLLGRYLPDRFPRVVLDAGCGTGGLLNDLERFGKLVAVDFSAEAVKFCKLRGYDIMQCSVLQLPFRSNSFDLVVGLDLIEHLDDDEMALRDLYRVCKPGGLLCLTVPAFQFLWSRHDDLNHHKRRYTKQRLERRLKSTCFQVLRCSYFNSFLFPFVLVGRLFGRGGGEEPGPEWHLPKPTINSWLSRIFAAELPLLRWLDLPFGVSILAIARKV